MSREKVRRRCVCEHCGTVFYVVPSAVGRFCSRHCMNEGRRTRPKNDPRPCETCGTTFKPDRSSGDARFCSARCIGLSPKGRAKAAKMARDTGPQRGDLMRGKGAGKTYRKRNGRHEHRLVAEEKIGRPLRNGEVVHHIDGDKHNNDPDNLAVMSQREHMLQHGLGLPGVPPRWKTRENRQ